MRGAKVGLLITQATAPVQEIRTKRATATVRLFLFEASASRRSISPRKFPSAADYAGRDSARSTRTP